MFSSVPPPLQDEIGEKSDVRKAISMSFWYPEEILFGLPEREESFSLKDTSVDEPYQLFATD
jgi:hypothetical protein